MHRPVSSSPGWRDAGSPDVAFDRVWKVLGVLEPDAALDRAWKTQEVRGPPRRVLLGGIIEAALFGDPELGSGKCPPGTSPEVVSCGAPEFSP